MIPIYEPGDMQREPYHSTPYVCLLFRNFNLLFYFRPTALGWHEWYVHDDFGNLVRVNTSGGRLYGLDANY